MYPQLARRFLQKQASNTKVISLAISALGTVPKDLVNGLVDFEVRGQMETLQTTELFRSARIPRRILET